MVTIVIGGDIYPSGNIERDFIAGNPEGIFYDLLDDIRGADLSIANLEAPLVSRATPIQKPGGVLTGNSAAMKGLAAAGWDVLNLANNHSFDHGTPGLLETMHVVQAAGVVPIGAGGDIEAAAIPFVRTINGQRVVVYAMAEREFSIADENSAGANPLDLIHFVSAVKRYKQDGVFITLIHGGQEFYPYPSPEMMRRCRFMVEMGADAVICCHTHCPLPWETWQGRPIAYGLGNLIFEPFGNEPASWYQGYMVRLTIADKQVTLETLPYTQSRPGPGAQKMQGLIEKKFYEDMEFKNAKLKDAAFIKSQWHKFCEDKEEVYLSMLFGYNKVMRKVHRILLPLLHLEEDKLRALLLVQCETHREVLDTLFSQKRKSGR